MKEVNYLRLTLRQLTRNENEPIHTRNKRGVFNFIRGIGIILFGTLDIEDANYYFGKLAVYFMNLSKEQITEEETNLRFVNSTLLMVSENEKY